MKHRVYTAPRAILAQFGLTLVLALALLPWGLVPAYSALIGGLVAASANALVCHRGVLVQGADATYKITETIRQYDQETKGFFSCLI